MRPHAGDGETLLCTDGSWKVRSERAVSVQRALRGWSACGAAPSSSCPLHPSPQPGHRVGLVAEQGEKIGPKGPVRWLARSVSHLTRAVLGSASLNTAPVTSSSRARGGCGDSGVGPGAASLLARGAEHGLPHPVLDVSANRRLSAGLWVIY